jgi:acyl carrier protein
MDKQAFLSKLANILEIETTEMNETFELNADNWDSTAILEVIALLDQDFDLTIPVKTLKSCVSVGNLVELVEQAQAKA